MKTFLNIILVILVLIILVSFIGTINTLPTILTGDGETSNPAFQFSGGILFVSCIITYLVYKAKEDMI